jgi:hypothetical protein
MHPLNNKRVIEIAGKIKKPIKIYPIGNWRYAEGKDIYIFRNNLSLNSYTIIVDKKTGDVIDVRKAGINEKFKNLFGR